jgi:hypothetical protein
MYVEARSGFGGGSDLEYRIGAVIAGSWYEGGSAFGVKPIDVREDLPRAFQDAALKGGPPG